MTRPPVPGSERLGPNLRAARLARGYSQQALARAAGVDQRYVGYLEDGTRGRRSASAWHLYRLARALGVRIEDLLGLERLA